MAFKAPQALIAPGTRKTGLMALFPGIFIGKGVHGREWRYKPQMVVFFMTFLS